MECGLNATEDGQHRTRGEFQMLLKCPFDLPILIEIDNYGKMPPGSSIACNSEGDDEITAYMKKPRAAREAFLRHYYAEFRTYKGYDQGLKVGPYYFGYLNDLALGNWVDHFAYQDGLLINYWDTSQADNNTTICFPSASA